MATDQQAAQTLRDSGHKLTPQRLMILSVVEGAEGHLTASEILDRAKGTYPYLDVSTVYRTLAVLKEMGLVSETDMGGGEYRYEWVAERHHHLVCRTCRSAIEVDHGLMERLAGELHSAYGFHAEVDHMAIFGQCGRCRSE